MPANMHAMHGESQDILAGGQFHPSVNASMVARVGVSYAPDEYPSDDMRAAGVVCGCGQYYQNPCRAEFRKARAHALP